MDGLGEDRHRPGDRSGDDLERDQAGVGDDRQRGGALLERRLAGGLGRGAHVTSHGRARSPRPASQSASARSARPRWLIASFSSSLELGHRAAGRVLVRHERRVVAEAAACRAARAASVPRHSPKNTLLGTAAGRRRPARTRSEARCPTGASRISSAGSPRRWRPRRRTAPSARPGAPPSASASIPESSAIARPARRRGGRRAPSAARCPRTSRRPRAGARLRSGSGTDERRQAPAGGANSRSLCALRVASTRVESGATATSARRRRDRLVLDRAQRLDPAAASASRSSRCARESGVRSAVAWTSIRPPSPVITTFASTSAVESSE